MVELFLALMLLSGVIIIFLFVIAPKKVTLNEEEKDIADFFPVQTIESEGYLIGENGEFTVGFRLMLPEVFLNSEEEIRELHKSWGSFMRTLPDGTKIQKQDFYFIEEYKSDENPKSILDKKNEELYQGRNMMKHYSLLYLTFYKEERKDKRDLLTRRARAILKNPFEGVEKRWEELKKTVEGVEARLKGFNGFSAVRMGAEELREELYRFVTQSYDNRQTDSLIIPDISLSKEGDITIGKRKIAVISMVEEGGTLEPSILPKTASASVYNNGVNYQNRINGRVGYPFPIHCGLPIKHCVNTVIKLVNNESMINELNGEKGSLNFLATFYKPAKVKQQVIEGFINDVVSNDFQTCTTTVNVMVDSEDVSGLYDKVNHVESAFMNMNQTKCFKETFEAGGVFFEMIPGTGKRCKRELRNVTLQASCYINNEGMTISNPTGIKYADRYGNPVMVELWDNKHTENRNKIIFGPSGSGKSYFINGLVAQTYQKGNHVIILEIGRSTKRNCELHGGLYFDTADRDKLRFNVFDCKRDEAGRYVYRDMEDKESQDDKINFLSTIITAIWKGRRDVENLELEMVRRSLVAYYEYVNGLSEKKASMVGYYEFLKVFKQSLSERELQIMDIDGLRIMLEKYAYGVYRDLLNGDREIDIDQDRFIVFEMEGVQNDAELFTLVSVIIIEMVLQKIKRLKGVKKSLIIDEALNFLEDPKMGSFIGYLYRTIRKKEGEVYIAAQNVKFLDGIAPMVRDSIIINTDTKILLDHSKHKSSYADLRRILSLNESQIGLLDSLVGGNGFREFLIILGRKNGIFRMEVSEFADSIYTSKEKDVREIERIFEQVGSLPAAVEQYIHNKKMSYEN